MSSKQISLLSLGIALLALVGLATFLLPESDDTAGVQRDAAVEPALSASGDESTARTESELAAAPAPTPAIPADGDEARSSVAEELSYTPAEGRWITGQVTFPDGVAGGDGLEVFALSQAMGYARFVQLSLPKNEEEAEDGDDDALEERASIRSRAPIMVLI